MSPPGPKVFIVSSSLTAALEKEAVGVWGLWAPVICHFTQEQVPESQLCKIHRNHYSLAAKEHAKNSRLLPVSCVIPISAVMRGAPFNWSAGFGLNDRNPCKMSVCSFSFIQVIKQNKNKTLDYSFWFWRKDVWPFAMAPHIKVVAASQVPICHWCLD